MGDLMPGFLDSLSSFDATEQKLVQGKLRTFARHSSLNGQFHRNLKEEQLVPAGTWKELAVAVLNSSTDPPKFSDAIRVAFRKCLFGGPPAKCASHTIFGRAITPQSLARTFLAQGRFGSLAGALAHVRAMKGKDLRTLRTKWRDYQLARFVMWSTFDPGGKRPFEGLKRSAQHLRAILGLTRIDSDSPLLLLEYMLPKGSVPRLPTVVEAYAGDEWLPSFRPATEVEIEDGYGRTYVWEEFASEEHSGRPEVVHEPITGHLLTSELEEVV